MPGEDVTKKVRSETSLEGDEESGYLPGGKDGESKAHGWVGTGWVFRVPE